MDENRVLPPDPDEAEAELAGVEAALEGLTDDGLVEALERWTAHHRQVEAMLAAVVVAVHDRVVAQDYVLSGAVQTVAAITGTSSRAAAHAVDVADVLTRDPLVWRALATGRIDKSSARIIAEGFAEVPVDDRDDVTRRALEYAERHTAYQTRRKVARLLVDYDPALGAEQRDRERAKAWSRRCIRVFPAAHGMAEISGYVPAGSARILIAALDRVARTYDDDRTLDQKRVDALAEILAENTRLDITVDVSIPADTLVGLQQRGASVAGFGPVDAEDARAMALQEDARWRRLVTDPVTGRLDSMTSSAYRIPASMKAAVRARDRICRFPGCSTDARHTDTDHVVPWPRGATHPGNLGPGCRTHHRVKTHSSWRCDMRDDGAMVWTSPLGSRHVTHPWDYNDPDW